MASQSDFSELHRLMADLNRAPAEVRRHARTITQKAALNIKTDLNNQALGSPHFWPMTGSITYETEDGPDGSSAEIGPDKDRLAGALGNLFFFGGANGGGGTGDLDAPLRAEVPRMEEFFRRALDGLL